MKTTSKMDSSPHKEMGSNKGKTMMMNHIQRIYDSVYTHICRDRERDRERMSGRVRDDKTRQRISAETISV